MSDTYMIDRACKTITFLQSADLVRYARLLLLSAQTVQRYCVRHGFAYDQTLGIRYGAKPWHAALNRIKILNDYLDRGYSGWIVYIDADALIVDLSFDLRAYLQERRHAALIAAPSGHVPARWWEINNGVFAINLAHPLGRELVRKWHERLLKVPEDVLALEQRWGDVADDQQLMHGAMQVVHGLEEALVIDRDPAVLNWDGAFIQQVVRERGSLDQRVQRLRARVAEVLGTEASGEHFDARSLAGDDGRRHALEEFADAIYRVLLRREPDPGGFNACVAALERGDTSFADELRACLACEEFSENITSFANDLLDDAARNRLRMMR